MPPTAVIASFTATSGPEASFGMALPTLATPQMPASHGLTSADSTIPASLHGISLPVKLIKKILDLECGHGRISAGELETPG